MGRPRDQRGTLIARENRRGEVWWWGRFRFYRPRGKTGEHSTRIGLASEISEAEARSRLFDLIQKMNRRSAEIHTIGPEEVLKLESASKPGRPDRFNAGAISELVVSADLTARGYEVFRAVSGQASCDLLAMKDGSIQRIEVKSGSATVPGQIRRNAGKFDLVAIYWKTTGRIEYVSAMELAKLKAMCGNSEISPSVK